MAIDPPLTTSEEEDGGGRGRRIGEKEQREKKDTLLSLLLFNLFPFFLIPCCRILKTSLGGSVSPPPTSAPTPPTSLAPSAPPPPPPSASSPLHIPSVTPEAPPPPPPPAAAAAAATKGLEMFLLQRAKALQHANPALKALVDLQAASAAGVGAGPGTAKPWLGDLVSKAITPPSPALPLPSPDQGGPPTDPLSSWRKTLESSLLFPPISSSSPTPLAPALSSLSPHSLGGGGGLNRAATPTSAASAIEPHPIPRTPSKSPPNPISSSSLLPSSLPHVITTTAAANGDSPLKHGGGGIKGSPFKSEGGPEPLYPLPPSLMHAPPGIFSASRIPKSDPLEGHLQDMLRYNMEKYAGQALDTVGSARRVRELLSVHNIGQRLFAKYVLGLSQGTVSELLSKPKCWEKLTEKGRDSYRKMHAWAWDENAVLLLKSLIPRKGEITNQQQRRLKNVLTPRPDHGFPGESDKAKAAAAAAAAATATAEAMVPRYPFPPPPPPPPHHHHGLAAAGELGFGPKMPYQPLMSLPDKVSKTKPRKSLLQKLI